YRGAKDVATRFRITLNGHLVQEALGVYDDNNQGNWTTVWSSIPIHLDHPVGVYGSRGYTLFLQDDGELELLDGANVRIWSSHLSSTKLGFKFPYDSIYPSVIITDANEPKQKDPHNSFPEGISSVATDTLTANCSSFLGPNQSIVSANGRFALILRNTGNLLLKDGVRTMWESSTADLWYAVPPYRAGLSTVDGAFRVKDSENNVIWETQAAGGGSLQLNNCYLYKCEAYIGQCDGDESCIEDYLELKVRRKILYGTSLFILPKIPIFCIFDRNETSLDIPIGYHIFQNPVVDCDMCTSCQFDGAPAPIVHLATGKCLSYTQNTLVPVSLGIRILFFLTTDLQAASACLGNMTTVLGFCDSRNAWRHYDDGLLTLANAYNLCLGPRGLVSACDDDGLRLNKLWSFGGNAMIMPRLSTASGQTRLMLAGQQLSAFSTTFFINVSGDMIVKSGTAYNVIRSASKLAAGDLPLLELTKSGELVMSNLYGNVTYSTVTPTSGGVGPFVLAIPQKGVVTLRDSRGISIWSLRVA
ncbi:hypothetical protein HK101_005413, partial [Irineochytrium annulatum]